MTHILTFDFGTSYFKVCLFDQSLQLVARNSRAVPLSTSELGRCELPVHEFERCLAEDVREIGRKVGGLGNVTKVCFASQANTFTLLDRSDASLIPFLIWSDQRASDLGEFVEQFSGGRKFYSETGIAHFDHRFMPAKLRWLELNLSSAITQARRVVTLSDYFVWWLTGRFLTEAGLAGLTGMVDIHRLKYRTAALELLHLSQDKLPPVVRAGSDTGPVCDEVISAWGLSPSCRLVMGCLDQYAGAIGAGITAAGGICETTGTVLATVRCAQAFDEHAAPGVFQGPSFSPGRYFQMVFSSLSAGILERYRNLLPDRPAFHELDRLAANVPAGAEGLQFNRAAVLDGSVDMFLRRTSIHRRGHDVRALLEAVAEELQQQVATLCGNDRPASIKSCGGAARSRLWLDIKRETVGCNFEPVDCPEPTSLGAARLATWSESA